MVLNKEINSSATRYLIFIGDDCLMHPCFIKRHIEQAASKQFLTGSLIRLGAALTRQIIQNKRVIWNEHRTLADWEPRNYSEYLKSMPVSARVMGVLDRLSPARRSWAGCNSSAFLEDVVRINGFTALMRAWGTVEGTRNSGLG